MKSLYKFLALSLVCLGSLSLVACDKNVTPTQETTPAHSANNQTNSATSSLEQLPSQGIPDGVLLAEQQVLHLALEAPITNTDLTANFESSTAIVYGNVFETLVRIGRDGSVIPAAAQAYEVSADGLTWTFHLRPEAKWHDGKNVVAQDFVYSWQRLISSPQAPYSSYLVEMAVVNAQEILAGTQPASSLGVKALDDYTLQVNLVHPVSWLDAMVTLINLAPLRADLIEQNPYDWFYPGKVVGNGPFTYVSNNKGLVVLEKAENYWNEAQVALTQVTLQSIGDAQTRLAGFNEGKFDFFRTYNLNFAQLAQDQGLEVHKYLPPMESYLFVNEQHQLSTDVRKALALLIPLADTQQNFNPYYKVAPDNIVDAQLLPEYSWANLNPPERITQSLELLKAHGYTTQHPLKLRYLLPEQSSHLAVIFEYMSKSVEQAVIFEPVFAPLDQNYNAQYYDVDLMWNGWAGDYNQVTTFMNMFLCSNTTFSTYCNQQYDQLMEQATKEVSRTQRQQLYAQAATILNQELPAIYLDIPVEYYVARKDLVGYSSVLLDPNFQDWFFVAQTPSK